MTDAQVRATYAVAAKLRRFFRTKRYASLCIAAGKRNRARFARQDALAAR